MAKPCFYHPELSQDILIDSMIELSPSESAHALQARRLSVGSQVRLISGDGVIAEAEISETAKRHVNVTIARIEKVEVPHLKLHIAVAMPKGDRQKVMVAMLTQLGVSSITPMICEHSVSVPKPSQLVKLRRISIEACKQSQNPWAVTLNEPLSFESLIESDALLVYANQGGRTWQLAKSEAQLRTDTMVLIGPEGGFSLEELNSLKASGAVSMTLGSHTLRTESAAIAAASLFKC